MLKNYRKYISLLLMLTSIIRETRLVTTPCTKFPDMAPKALKYRPGAGRTKLTKYHRVSRSQSGDRLEQAFWKDIF